MTTSPSFPDTQTFYCPQSIYWYKRRKMAKRSHGSVLRDKTKQKSINEFQTYFRFSFQLEISLLEIRYIKVRTIVLLRGFHTDTFKENQEGLQLHCKDWGQLQDKPRPLVTIYFNCCFLLCLWKLTSLNPPLRILLPTVRERHEHKHMRLFKAMLDQIILQPF